MKKENDFRLFYLSTSRDDKQHPYLLEVLQETPHPDKDHILHYLESGRCFLGSPSKFADVVADPPKWKGHYIGGNWLTDGKWIWCTDLVIYLKRYNILVPDDFLAHMKQRSWNAPKRPRFNEKAIVNFLFSRLPE